MSSTSHVRGKCDTLFSSAPNPKVFNKAQHKTHGEQRGCLSSKEMECEYRVLMEKSPLPTASRTEQTTSIHGAPPMYLANPGHSGYSDTIPATKGLTDQRGRRP